MHIYTYQLKTFIDPSFLKLNELISLLFKKIHLVVAAILLSGVAIYYVYKKLSARNMTGVSSSDLKPTQIFNDSIGKKKIETEPKGEIEKDATLSLESVAEAQPLCKDPSTEDSPLQKILEENCAFAAKQQKKDKPMNFKLVTGSIPDEFTVNFFTNGDSTTPLLNSIVRQIDNPEGIVIQKSSIKYEVGIASCIGRRTSMEDADIVYSGDLIIQDKTYPIEVFAICDGHGGDAAALFVKKELVSHLETALLKCNSEKLTDEGIAKGIEEAFYTVDLNFKGSDKTGTTLVMAMCLNGKLWVGNVGDSRMALLQKSGKVIQGSADMNLKYERYRKRMEALTKKVQQKSDVLTGAIGDKYYNVGGKRIILPNPDITCFSLDEVRGGHILLLCDGVTVSATTNEFGSAVYQLVQNNESVKEVAKRMVYSIIRPDPKDAFKGSHDNVTFMAIRVT